MSNRKSKDPQGVLDDAIAEINLVEQALFSLSDDTNTYEALRTLISDLRREHDGMLDALQVHASQKDRLSKGVLGFLTAALGTIPSWVKIQANLKTLKGMLKDLEQRASAHQELLEVIDQLKQATQTTRASLNAYNDARASEEANRRLQGDPDVSIITQNMTVMHFGRGLDNQTTAVRAPDGYTSTRYFSRQSSQQGTASDPQTRASAPIQPSRSASEGFRASIPPQAPNMSGFATNAQLGQGYTGSAQGLGSHDGRVPLGRDHYRQLFPSVLASQPILPARYFEQAGPTHGQPHRKSNEIPPPEPDAPYTPPNALSPPPRHFYAYGDSSAAQSPSFPGFFPSQVTGPSSGQTHTRGLSDLSAFNNANRSASSVGSREYASSQSTSGASDQPQDVRTRASFSGDSWDGSRQYTNHTLSYQRDNGSFDAESGISSRSKSSGS